MVTVVVGTLFFTGVPAFLGTDCGRAALRLGDAVVPGRSGCRAPGALGAGVMVVVVTDGRPGTGVFFGCWPGIGSPGMVTPGGRHTPRTTHCWVGMVVVGAVVEGTDGSPGLRLSDGVLSRECPGLRFLLDDDEDFGRLGSGIGLVGMTPVE